MKEDPSGQNIARISFRQLLDSIEDGDRALDESISFNPDDTPFDRTRKRFGTIISKLRKSKLKSIWFFAELFSYLSMRFRIVYVLMDVFFEFISNSTEGIRRNVIKGLYWGRGSIFKLLVQFLIVIVVVVSSLSYIYRSNSTTQEVESAVMAQALGENTEQDLVVQKASTITTTPEERGNIDITTHIVKPGDTLFRIAKENDISVDTILWANPFIQNQVIHSGDVLKIPQYDGVVVKAAKGDTVYSLAKKWKIEAQNIADKNLLEYPYELEVGKEYILPGAVMPTPPRSKTTVYSGVFNPKVSYTSGSSRVSGVGRFLAWPVAGGAGSVSQCYNSYHNGIDIRSLSGFPKIVAAAPGKVVFAGCQSGNCPARGIGAWGGTGLAWTVIISHGNGVFTVYGHLDDIYIGSGSTVSTGTVIGKMGRTGYATGTHLHLMTLVGSGSSGWTKWDWVNPANYFKTRVCW